MKAFLGILSGIVYLLSANALVHAGSMGFFDHNQNTSNHCQAIHNTDNSQQQKNNIDCCELVYSNEYSTNKIAAKSFFNKYFSIITPQIIIFPQIQEFKKLSKTNSPPGWNTDNKYNNFSDLVGIIVKLI